MELEENDDDDDDDDEEEEEEEEVTATKNVGGKKVPPKKAPQKKAAETKAVNKKLGSRIGLCLLQRRQEEKRRQPISRAKGKKRLRKEV
jgi:hypothetical protein